MRLFVALNFSEGVQEQIALATRPLVDAVPGIAWIKPGLLHLTLKFLGDCEPAMLERVAATGRAAARPYAVHEVVFTTFGAFPNLRRPRVVWLGMKGGEVLTEIAAALDLGAATTGVARETRPFRPHVTLARVRSALAPRDAEALSRAARTARIHLVSAVRSIDLMSSTLGVGGPHYEIVDTFPLGGG